MPTWRGQHPNPSGKLPIVFDASKGIYPGPPVRCNGCIGCRLHRSQAWAIRIMLERQQYDKGSFITLTYSEEHIPWDGSLNKDHLNKFIQDLRNYARRKLDIEIRYYAAGEYGDQLGRPHFHLCVFGLEFPDQELLSNRDGVCCYESKILEDLWGRGFTTTGELNYESAAYVARYVMKKITGDMAEDHYTTTHPITGEIIKLEPEYNTMSRRPGIGKIWFDKYQGDVYPSDFLIRNGNKIPVPKYFDKLFEEAEPETFDIIKQQRKLSALSNKEDNTPERLATKEKCKILNFKKLKRRLDNDS